MVAQEVEDRYVTEREIEKLTGRSVFTLRNDRSQNRGFPYVKNGRQVRYPLREVIQIMENKKIDPEAPAPRSIKADDGEDQRHRPNA